MQNILIVLLLGSELSYYLLIIQTGVVEYFHSDITLFWTLPVGGILGTFLAYKNISIFKSINSKLMIALFLQLVLSLAYPNLNLLFLFLLGFSAGVIAPMLILLFVNSKIIYAVIALALAYVVGTLLFTTIPADRVNLAILFSEIAFISVIYLKPIIEKKERKSINYMSIAPLFIWLLLDSSLFEIISRSESVSIWRGDFTFYIITFHLIGLIVAYMNRDKDFNNDLIAILFAFSYIFYYFNEPILLAIVYPFFISYYNFFMFDKLIKIGNLKQLSFIVLFTCWIASGAGLLIALFNLIYIPIIFLIILFILNNNLIKKVNYA